MSEASIFQVTPFPSEISIVMFFSFASRKISAVTFVSSVFTLISTVEFYFASSAASVFSGSLVVDDEEDDNDEPPDKEDLLVML